MHVSFFWSKKPAIGQEYQVVGSRVGISKVTGFLARNYPVPNGTVLIYKGPATENYSGPSGSRKTTEHLFLWKEKHLEGYIYPKFEGALKAGFLLPIDKHAKRVAARYLAKTYNLQEGTPILYGKYKNKRGIIKEFKTDSKGNPTVVIEPMPKGRKQEKELQLFRIWKAPSEEKVVQQIADRILDGP